MSAATLERLEGRARLGLKGPNAAAWLVAQGVAVPETPNTYGVVLTAGDALLVARLGSTEFFLEHEAAGELLPRVARALTPRPAGVYPVLREDWGFLLGGAAADAVLAQVCNVNFAALDAAARPVVMTLMTGVAVLVIAQGGAAQRQYGIWCDPTFGPYLGETLEQVVRECGGGHEARTTWAMGTGGEPA